MITGRVQLCLGSSWREVLRLTITKKCPATHHVSVHAHRWHSSLEGTWQAFHQLHLQAFLRLWTFCLSLLYQGCNPWLSLLQDLLVVAMLPAPLLYAQLELEDRIANGKSHLSFLISPDRQWAWSHRPAQWVWEHHLGPSQGFPPGSGLCFFLEEWDRRVREGQENMWVV